MSTKSKKQTSQSARNRRQKRSPSTKTPTSAKSGAKMTQVVKVAPSRAFLSNCAADYARCLVNPFDGPLACVPSDLINDNLITRNWVRGNFACGSNTGFVCADPIHGAFNDVPCVISSKASFTGNSIDLNDTANINADLGNSQFAETAINNLNSGLSYRVVAAGLRVRYRGTELDRGGSLIALVDPTHDALLVRTISQLNGEKQARRFPIDRKWTTIHYHPVNMGELAMSPSAPNANTKTPNIIQRQDFWFMGFMIEPPSSTTFSSFEYEFYVVAEYQGRNVRGQKITHADPVGLAAAVQASATFAPTQTLPAKHEETMLSKVAHDIQYGLSHMDFIPFAADIVQPHVSQRHPHDFVSIVGDTFRDKTSIY